MRNAAEVELSAAIARSVMSHADGQPADRFARCVIDVAVALLMTVAIPGRQAHALREAGDHFHRKAIETAQLLHAPGGHA